jgi:hypothetical protein
MGKRVLAPSMGYSPKGLQRSFPMRRVKKCNGQSKDINLFATSHALHPSSLVVVIALMA